MTFLSRQEQTWISGRLKRTRGGCPDLDQLRRLIRPNTKMICINNANNPTGALMDAAYLEELVAIAKEVDAYIFSDEVYRSFDQPAPSIVDLYEKGIAVNSLSKTYSIPGIRVGWLLLTQRWRTFCVTTVTTR